MRLQITFTPAEKETLTIPLEYQQILQGIIYRNMKDREYSTFLHDVGFQYEKRSFKLFTFSQLNGKKHNVNVKDKTITFYNQITWIISSVLPPFIQLLGQSFLQADAFHINGQKMIVEELRYFDSANGERSKCKMKMLSPVTVYSTFVDRNGKKITQYYTPSDPAFSHLIAENLYKKYEAYYGEKINEPITIKAIGKKQRKIITRFKGFIINAWNGEFLLEGSPKLIHFAYDVGLGHKCSMGFGLFEMMDSDNFTY